MSKITPDHLARHAYVYVRQSTPDQILHHQESRRRQYGLADRARQLGWSEVVIVDDDLGRSGGGVVRPGFERLLVAPMIILIVLPGLWPQLLLHCCNADTARLLESLHILP